MKRLITVVLPLFGMMALLVTGPLALAAKPQAPVTETVSLHTGVIDYLDPSKGVIVVSDMEYALSDKLTINGKTGGARQSLRKGLHIKFSFSFVTVHGRPVISEIVLGQ